jgi:hypothetical protein
MASGGAAVDPAALSTCRQAPSHRPLQIDPPIALAPQCVAADLLRIPESGLMPDLTGYRSSSSFPGALSETAPS